MGEHWESVRPVLFRCDWLDLIGPFRTAVPFWEQIIWNQSQTYQYNMLTVKLPEVGYIFLTFSLVGVGWVGLWLWVGLWVGLLSSAEWMELIS